MKTGGVPLSQASSSPRLGSVTLGILPPSLPIFFFYFAMGMLMAGVAASAQDARAWPEPMAAGLCQNPAFVRTRPLSEPSRHQHLLLGIERYGVFSVGVQVAEEGVLPSREREERHGSGDGHVDADHAHLDPALILAC